MDREITMTAIHVLFGETAAKITQANADGKQVDTMTLQGTAVVALGLATVLLVGWIASKVLKAGERQGINDPRRMLRELFKAHQLPRSQQRLLKRIIKAYRLEPPARLLVEPERFDVAAQDPAFQSQRGRILTLKQRLFSTATSA
jgi:hypothetical protein